MLVEAAYGRTYLTADAVRKDWDADKDFYIVPTENIPYGGRYINRQDAIRFQIDNAIVARFGKPTAYPEFVLLWPEFDP